VSTATITFILSLAGFTGIGLLSALRRRKTTEDYLVAGRAVPPWLTALSAVATNNSGFMFIGLIGFTYRHGLQAIWISLGWVMGDLLAWLWVYRRVRRVSGAARVNSMPALLGWRSRGQKAGRPRGPEAGRPGGPEAGRPAGPEAGRPGGPEAGRPAGREQTVVVLAGALTFLFLGVYAAAQLKAGSTALQALLGWPPESGAVLGAAIVIAYSFAGGLRASIWTDAAQSLVMMVAMALLLGIAAQHAGAPTALPAQLAEQDPTLARWVPAELAFGLPLYALGFVVGGFGVIGQPHIVIRPMALESPAQIARARFFYFLWFVPFTLASFGVGLYARVLMPDLLEAAAGAGELARVNASEQALPELAARLLPEAMAGLALAGLFAATISTADSQVLACSAAITQDAFPRWRRSYLASKVATGSVALLALGVALSAGRGVFALVLVAWSALAAALGPLLLLLLAGRPPGPRLAVAMAAAGVATVVAWERSPWADDVFKLLPAMAVAFGVALVGGLASRAFPGRRSG